MVIQVTGNPIVTIDSCTVVRLKSRCYHQSSLTLGNASEIITFQNYLLLELIKEHVHTLIACLRTFAMLKEKHNVTVFGVSKISSSP